MRLDTLKFPPLPSLATAKPGQRARRWMQRALRDARNAFVLAAPPALAPMRAKAARKPATKHRKAPPRRRRQ